MIAPRSESELLNVLVAYPYMSDRVIKILSDGQEKIRFLLDSGAFTAWKAKKKIEVDDYCRFIESMPFKPWRYFTLDVVGDPAGTMRNYLTMVKRGFKPVPIFTRGEDLSVIDDYYETSDVVGVGGLVGTPGNKGFVNGVMKRVKSRRCHWLGFTSVEFLKHYRPYMCDSSTWEVAMYGGLVLYDRAGMSVKLSKADFAKRPTKRVVDLIRSYGVDPAVFARDASGWSTVGSGNRMVNAMSAVRMSLDVQRSLGTLLFMAASAGNGDVARLLHGYDFEMKRGTT